MRIKLVREAHNDMPIFNLKRKKITIILMLYILIIDLIESCIYFLHKMYCKLELHATGLETFLMMVADDYWRLLNLKNLNNSQIPKVVVGIIFFLLSNSSPCGGL